MTNSNDGGSKPRERGSFGFALLLFAVAIVVYFALQRQPSGSTRLIGLPLPPLVAAGWFNAAAPPSNESLRGKVVVLDCWFVDCPPCRASMPHLVEFHKKFRNQDVVLIGLTPDSGSDVPRAEEFIRSVPGIDWPIGYDARIPLGVLEINAYPTMIVFDRTSDRTFPRSLKTSFSDFSTSDACE